MNEFEWDICLAFAKGEIGTSALFDYFSSLKVTHSTLAITILDREIALKNPVGINGALLLFNRFGFSEGVLPSLRAITLDEWHRDQEWIATVLGEFHKPEDVPLLMQMAFAKFEHIEIEGYDSLLLKCMRALGKFDCQQALDGLIVISKVDNVDVAEEIQWHIDQVRQRMANKAQLPG